MGKSKTPHGLSHCQKLARDLDSADYLTSPSYLAKVTARNNTRSGLVRLPPELRQEILCLSIDDKNLVHPTKVNRRLTALRRVCKTFREDTGEVRKRWLRRHDELVAEQSANKSEFSDYIADLMKGVYAGRMLWKPSKRVSQSNRLAEGAMGVLTYASQQSTETGTVISGKAAGAPRQRACEKSIMPSMEDMPEAPSDSQGVREDLRRTTQRQARSAAERQEVEVWREVSRKRRDELDKMPAEQLEKLVKMAKKKHRHSNEARRKRRLRTHANAA